ncbi:MAG: response regulator, partial [Opitutaceae bacterium]|nr:response regulator [Opitutaceae bacterium]
DLGAVLVVRDVTEHARLESDLRRASNLESIGILAGGIAHDFNNILAIIMGNLTLALLDEQVKASGGKRWLLEAERGAARARDLTQQLLTFAKGGEPVRTNVQLPELVREAAEFALHGSSARCEFAIPEGLPTADVDKAQIGQVVQNLVLNAVQAMPAGGVIRIAMGNVTLAEDEHPPLAAGDYLRLSIADTGRGIHPDHLPRIFEPYFTTKSAGVGLGLATVYSIVRKHRGHIMVESELDAGTTFHLWLPAAAEAEAPRRPNPAPFAEAMQGRVLFMDDEEPIRLMAAVLLGRLGLDPTIAEDGAEAVRQFRQAHGEGRPFDAVVMDLTVPGGVGGLEALREMQTIDPDVRAIVSSGYSSDPVLANFRAHGFRGMVAKPYRITALAAALRAVMDEDKAG